MVRYKGDYKKESFCSNCEEWTPEPTTTIKDMAIEILPNPDIDRHPEIKVGRVYYDEKGRKHTILARLYLLNKKWVKKIVCRKCGKQCRGGPLSKNKKNGKDKQRARQENMIPDSVKINLIEDTIRRLKTQVEYENDPSLRLDDPEAKQAGTLSSMIRPYVETTLEELERLRNKIQLLRPGQLESEGEKQQQHISKEQQEVINRRNEAQARILYLKVKREIKQLEEKLGREIQFVPIVDIIEEEEDEDNND